jgi:putative oxidoreductase
MRLLVGYILASNGIMKFADLDKYIGIFRQLAIPVPEVMTPMIAALEAGGGIALILGLLTRLFGLAFAGEFAIATLSVLRVGQHGYFEMAMIGIGFTLSTVGAGKISLDRMFQMEN